MPKGYIYLGRDTEGKEIRRYASAKTEKALKRKLDDLKKKYTTGQLTPMTATLAIWAAKWLETKHSKSAATYQDYAKIVNKYIIPELGHKKVNQVMQIDIQDFINSLSDRPRTAQKAKQVLKAIFDLAVVNRLASSNPVTRIERPSAKPKKKRSLTPYEVTALQKANLSLEDRVLVGLMNRCGLRKAEAAAMHINHISIEREHSGQVLSARVCVDRVIDFATNELRPYPKSDAGNRTVPVFSDFLPDLVKYVEQCDGFLFQKEAGGTLTESAFARRWERIKHYWNKAAGGVGKIDQKTHRYRETLWSIGKDISPHLLRHNYASDLADYGYSPKEIQTLLGHSDAKISLDIYAHKLAEDIDASKGNGALSELS